MTYHIVLFEKFVELLLQVHPSSVLEGDEYGKFPMYIVYHELISTTRPYMRNICAVEQAWVEPILKKLEKLDVNRLRYSEEFATQKHFFFPNYDPAKPFGS